MFISFFVSILHVQFVTRQRTFPYRFEYSTAIAIKALVLFLHSPLASSYSIKISIKIFGSGNDECGKLNIIEATGNRSQNLRNYLPREIRLSNLRFIGLLYYNTILLWDLTMVYTHARARAHTYTRAHTH